MLTEWVIRINKKPDPFLQIHYLAGGHSENAISSVILARALHISPEAQAYSRTSGEMDGTLVPNSFVMKCPCGEGPNFTDFTDWTHFAVRHFESDCEMLPICANF